MKFKKNIFGFIDMLMFTHKVPKRKKHFNQGSGESIPSSFPTNELAKFIHYAQKPFVIDQIIPHNKDLKTYVLKPADCKPLPAFIPGAYVRLKINNDQCFASAPFSIASSPLDAKNNNCYKFTIKRNPKGTFTNYLLDHMKVNDQLICSSPYGSFNINELRDHHNIVCLAGGSGITPFASMAKAIYEGSISDVDLFIFYGVKTPSEAVWYDEIKEYAKQNSHIHIVLVAEHPTNEQMAKGFITKALVEQHVKAPYTVFACGPNAMYGAITKEFKNLPMKDLRCEANVIGNRTISNVKKVKIKVHQRDQIYEISANNSETILKALEKARINAPSRCMAGKCGFCHAKCISGKYTCAVEHRRGADIKFNYIHPCCTYPDSDMEIVINADN